MMLDQRGVEHGYPDWSWFSDEHPIGLGQMCADGLPPDSDYGCVMGGAVGAGSGGGSWLQNLINSVAGTASQYILRPEPGTYVQRGPNGEIIYRQPTGNQANLPFAAGTVNVGGQANVGTGLVLAAVAIGVLVLVMTGRGGR
jgi:hypothetical protein